MPIFFKLFLGVLIEEIDILKEDIGRLKEIRKSTSKHILLGDLPEQDRFSQLESTCNVDNVRALLRNIYTMEADIIPEWVYYSKNTKESSLAAQLLRTHYTK